MNIEIEAGIEAFITKATAVRKVAFDQMTLEYNPQLTVMRGRKYARIVCEELPGARSVYCFIDLTNGDVLKAAGWPAPAPGARGNVLRLDAMHIDANGGCFYRR